MSSPLRTKDLLSVLLYALAVAVLPPAEASSRRITIRQAATLNWGSCITAQEWSLSLPNPPWGAPSCANFTVPLDWTNTSDTRTATLYVQKIPARNGAALGAIFTNPGGPGGSGATFLSTGGAATLYNITAGAFDIISWDPRGVGLSTPSINCFKQTENTSFAQAAVDQDTGFMKDTLQVRSSGPDQTEIDRFVGNATGIENNFNSFVKDCISNDGDNLRFVGTVATVKDLVALADAVEGPGKPIRYWGFSYGTFIGSAFIDLYPSRVGRVVLDGVLDPAAYSQKQSYQVWEDLIQDSDKSLQAFYDACAAAGPPYCAIATNGATGQTVKQWANALLDAAYNTQPPNPNNALHVRMLLQHAAFSPVVWKDQAILLSELSQTFLNQNSTSKRLIKRELPANFYATMKSAAYAIWCGDSADNAGTTTATVFNDIVRVTREVSNFFGPLALTFPSAFCHLWPVRAVERYQPSSSPPQLANSVLVIGNTYDAITPLVAARKVANRLNSSKRQAALVQHNGAGHVSLETYSACTWAIVNNYFRNGVLPEDTFCETNYKGSFGGNGTSDTPSTSIISAPLASGSTSAGRSGNGAIQSTHPGMLWMIASAIVGGLALGANFT